MGETGTVNPKFNPIPLDKIGEKNHAEPWSKPIHMMESKSVGKPLKPKEMKIPESKPLEPAAYGADSIQAVSATKFPTRVSEV